MFKWSSRTKTMISSSSDEDDPSSSEDEMPEPKEKSGYSRLNPFETTKEKPEKLQIPYDKNGYAPKPKPKSRRKKATNEDGRKSESSGGLAEELLAAAGSGDETTMNPAAAMGLIGKAGFIVKFMAILQVIPDRFERKEGGRSLTFCTPELTLYLYHPSHSHIPHASPSPIVFVNKNPAKVGEIMSAKNFKGNIKEHYGTEDPREVSKMIFHDLQVIC
jgi:hypothetical protein